MNHDTLEFLTTLTARRFRKAAEELESVDPELAADVREQAAELERANEQRLVTEGLLLFHLVHHD